MKTKSFFLSLLSDKEPDAVAVVKGNSGYPDINGVVKFYALPESGILISAEISDLPTGESEDTPAFFAFHIHENDQCNDNFQHTGTHFNPNAVPHPMHAGDLPPLLSNDGYVWTILYDSFLTLPMILNRSVIIHQNPDDFTTQPSGNSGDKIACGVIEKSRASIPAHPYNDNNKKED